MIALVALEQAEARREFALARLSYVIGASAGAKIDPPPVPRILERDP